MSPYIIRTAAPRYVQGSRNTSILLLHGWTGYPGQLYFLGEKLHEAGYSVMIPRLPGHGTSKKDFCTSGARDWFRRAEDACIDLSAEAENLVVAGISMGALLALHLGAVFQPAGIIAAAPALSLKNRTACLSPVLRYIIHEIPVNSDKESNDPDENYIRREYWSSRQLSAVAELLKVRQRVKKELGRINEPLLLLEAGQDELVRSDGISRIADTVSSRDIKIRLFPESEHQIFNGKEKQNAASEILGWLDVRFPHA